jgi:diadenylate cyclase
MRGPGEGGAQVATDPMLEALARVAPGTPLREAIENILRAHTGGLIVVGGEPEIDAMMAGGVRLDVPFAHHLLYELAKMDGAIVLDRDARRIRSANVELLPPSHLPSSETGMRHRTAERVARATEALVIAISQRRNLVSLYRGSQRYVLHDLGYILTKATQALDSLGRFDRLYRSAARRLGEAEERGGVRVGMVVECLRRLALAIQVRREIVRYGVELGREGRLVEAQAKEFPPLERLEEEWVALWLDYRRNPLLPVPEPPSDPQAWEGADWLARLEYPHGEVPVEPRGYRWLRKVPRLPAAVVERLVDRFGSLERLKRASREELDAIEGIGPQRASAIWQELHGQAVPEQLP